MNFENAKRLLLEVVESVPNFILEGPDTAEFLVASAPETEVLYRKHIELQAFGRYDFGLLLYVYSQDLQESVIASGKFRRTLRRTASAYDKQNVKMDLDGNKFFLGVGLLGPSTDILRVMATLSNMTLGVTRFEEALNKKFRLSLAPKY